MAWLAWTLLAFAAALAGHAVLGRLGGRLGAGGSAVKRFLLVGGPVGLLLIGGLLAGHGLAVQPIVAALAYGLLCELYLFLFTLAANSVTLGILRRLTDGPLDETQIAKDYDTAAMVDRRLDQLVAGGLLQREDDRYRPTAQGARTARSFARLRRLFRHPEVR
ncbi:hypothetical protein ACFOGJ_08120 [Marinibaculum pumilum]|uniref:HTH marR-type domain-containing protein n=1 Tax=Marinibaculum pumilum TaxID=1766165 RepID=A0ABV7KYE0_9PROT